MGRLCLPGNNLTCASCNESLNSLFEVSKLQIDTTIIVGENNYRKVGCACLKIISHGEHGEHGVHGEIKTAPLRLCAQLLVS